MRRIQGVGLSAVAGLAVALLSAPAAAAAASSADGPPDRGREQVFQIVARETQVKHIDRGKRGPSLGDELVHSGEILRHGSVVGSFGEVCTWVRAGVRTGEDDVQCVGTAKLPEGQFTTQGLAASTGDAPAEVGITGGTGAYRAAGGYIHSEAISETENRITVHVIR